MLEVPFTNNWDFSCNKNYHLGNHSRFDFLLWLNLPRIHFPISSLERVQRRQYFETFDIELRGKEGQGSPNGGIGCKCMIIFISLLSSRRKQTNVESFSPSLYKFKKRFLIKICVAMMTPGST